MLPLSLTAIGVGAYFIYQSTLLVDFACSEQCRIEPVDRVKDKLQLLEAADMLGEIDGRSGRD